MKGRALRRALETRDVDRIAGDVPLIQDTTELITPDVAYQMLERNKNNRPINWKKVEDYSAAMARGEWLLHAQGIVLDSAGNVLTGQKRLWAVIYSGASVYMRVSRGNPPESARLIDRHDPQSARDLAARGTGRKHRPTEASIARGILSLDGVLRPSIDQVAGVIETHSKVLEFLLAETTGTKKTRAVLMILAAAARECAGPNAMAQPWLRRIARNIDGMATKLATSLTPQTPESCWGRGAAFSLAMAKARDVVHADGALR